MNFKHITTWGKYLAAIDGNGQLVLIEIASGQVVTPLLTMHQINFQPGVPGQQPGSTQYKRPF